MDKNVSPHTYGFLISLAGVLAICPDTLLIRLIQAEGGGEWGIAFWRGLLTALGLTLFYRLAEGPGSLARFFRIDAWVAAAALVVAVQAVAFVLSVAHTKVANTLVIVATGPLFTAFFAWAFLRERPPLRTWLAIVAALFGIVTIFYNDLGSASLLGDLLALIPAAGLGLTFVIVRHRKAVNMMPAMAMGMLLSGIAVLPFAAPLAMSATGLGLTFVMGLVVLPLAFGLLTLGPRYLPAPEVSLMLLLETVLGPLIVWLAIQEVVPGHTILGGTIVLLALGVNSWLALSGRRAPRERPA